MTDDPTGTPRVVDKRGQKREQTAPPQESLFTSRIEYLVEEGRRRDLTEDERAELLQLQAIEAQREQPAADAPRVATAFLVILQEDGSAVATNDMSTRFYQSRQATTDDMYAGCSLVVRDIQSAMGSQQVILLMQQQMEAARQQAMAAQLANGGVPNIGGSRRR